MSPPAAPTRAEATEIAPRPAIGIGLTLARVAAGRANTHLDLLEKAPRAIEIMRRNLEQVAGSGRTVAVVTLSKPLCMMSSSNAIRSSRRPGCASIAIRPGPNCLVIHVSIRSMAPSLVSFVPVVAVTTRKNKDRHVIDHHKAGGRVSRSRVGLAK
jgi:hypothetical protein